MAHDKESLCHLSYDERVAYLNKLLCAEKGDLADAVRSDLIQASDKRFLGSDPEMIAGEIQAAQEESIKAGCEGIIVKSRDARYETNGTRVNSWIKLKNVNLQSSSDN